MTDEVAVPRVIQIETATTNTYARDWEAIACLNKKMAAVMGVLETLGEDARHQQGWRYTSYSAVANAIRQAMSAQGLALYVSLDSYEQREDGKGIRSYVKLEFTFADSEMGAMKVCRWAGEAVDYATKDKGLNKAYTAAEKYFLMRTFLVSTSDEVEPDSNGNQSRPQDETQEQSHWIEKEEVRKRFWAWTTDMALSNAEVHEALKVKHVCEYQGSMLEAKERIIAYVNAKATEERDVSTD